MTDPDVSEWETIQSFRNQEQGIPSGEHFSVPVEREEVGLFNICFWRDRRNTHMEKGSSEDMVIFSNSVFVILVVIAR